MSWPLVKLSEVTELINGDRSSNYPSGEDIVGSGILFLNTKNIVENKIDLKVKSFITPKKFESLSRGKLQKNDLIITLRGTLGSCCIFDTEFDTGFINAQMMIIRCKNAVFDKYLHYYLTSQAVYFEFQRANTGSAVPQLTGRLLADLEIPLPPLAEQKRIAAILDKADNIRQKRQQAIKLADDFLRSVFLDMFGDPVTNPKGWGVKVIKEIATVTTGGTPSRKVPEYYGDHIEWIKSDNINTPHHILTKASEYLSSEGLKVARTAPEGSTLITCIAGSFDCIGNAAFADREVSFNQQINALTPKGDILSWFLYALIIFSKKSIQNASTNSMKGMISKGKLEEVKLIIPPVELQRKFEDIFEKQINSVSLLNQSYTESCKLFNSLSQKAFAGDL